MMTSELHSVAARGELENEILLLCCRTQITEEVKEQIRSLLTEELDWEYLINEAFLHKVLPLIYNGIHEAGRKGIPPGILEQLKLSAHGIGLRNLLLSTELSNILRTLKERDIPAIPFKGPLLAMTLYNNLSLRQYNDLDLLVHKRDFAKAKSLLLEHGFKAVYDYSDKQEADYLQTQLHRESDGLVVEVQWGFTPKHFPFRLNPEQLWARQQTAMVAGQEMPNFAPEDLLLILCAHGTKHGWSRLSWICDIAEFVRTYPDLDWNEVLLRSRQANCARMVALGLRLAVELLNAPLPEDAARQLPHDPRLDAVVAQIKAGLFHNNGPTTSPIELSSLHLSMLESLADRIGYHRYIARRMVRVNEKDRELLGLPAALGFLSYIVRPFRLAWEYQLKRTKR